MAVSRRYAVPMDLWFDTPRLESLFRPVELETSSFGAINSYVTKDGTAVVHIDLPGVKKEDVTISHENGMVTIKAKRQINYKDDVTFKQESFAEVSRSFTIAEKVYDVDKSDASLQDGVLKISIPKKEQSKPAKTSIAIQ
mmetsp:Transcript_5173/g.9399  ORF Transcript_5173/g.9399 Transcript_5173/m.9399 type:complete len:140 (-) Transcript_5173:125-544(-)|eukprot:CAMPEP_0184695058 /NCGR_PEP_ID=MMETSP0313-20130426/2807_1 /TAXON_ID=2792 /ORGANISM="Porphyridium aerugineum, Strain SAG 1380-2" /LENGTH=139 /DNA_ID=CAMNT_0027153445 /DNA_START=120 /DNA_END=539 /DNA_ORIENTATION=+